MTQTKCRAAKLALSWILLCRSIGVVHGIGSRGIDGYDGRKSELFGWRGFKGVRSPRVTGAAVDSADEEGKTDDEVEFYGLARSDGEAMTMATGADNEEENAEADEALAKTFKETFISSHNAALREVTMNTSRNLNEQLSTIAISTFLLELTIQREPFRRGNIRNRRLSDESVDDLLQTLAERHLSSVYSNAFDDVPDPSQVLLTVVTTTEDDNDDDEKEDPPQQGGIYIRQSFIGGVVSFPTGSSDNNNNNSNNNDPARIPTRAELEQVTFQAFAIPGLGEDFLKELLRENHPELKGLLLLGAKEVEASQNGVGGNVGNGSGSGSGGGNLFAPGSNSNIDNGNNNDPTVDAQTDSANTKSNNKGAMDNVWAIAAVAALGAMFLTIILCTTVLYCDWRKRKERRNRKRTVAGGRRGNPRDYTDGNGNGSRGNHGKHSPRGGDSSHPNDEWNSSNGDEFNSLPSMDTEALRVVIPVPSGETDDQTPSPSTQGSDERDIPSHPNGVGKGTLRLSKSIRLSQKHKPSDDRARSRSTSVGRRGVSLPNIIKSKAANARLEETAGPAEQEDYVPEPAPSATYSVGEDTTVLFPAVHRIGGVGGGIGGGSAGGGSGILGRQSSKEADGNSYISDGEFDGYSVDAASTLEQPYGFDPSGGKGRGSGSANGSRGGGGSSLYSGDIPRDFDSVWDDESKITTSMDDDTFMSGMDRNRATAMQVNDETKKTYGDLSKNLNELVEHQFGDNKSTDSSSKNVNLYEMDSGSESGSSNRGAFTLELLGHNKASKGKKSTDDEDSILGDMYSQDGSLGLADESGSVGEGGKVPSSADSVDSTPSWAAPIQSALLRSSNAAKAAAGATNPSVATILRAPPSSTPLSPTVEYPSEDDSSSKQSRDRVKDKFVSSLSKNENDDRSTQSNGSNRSGKSTFNDSNTSLSSSNGNKNSHQPALGASRSEDHEVDDDPEEMIESINNMLSECRGILDMENSN